MRFNEFSRRETRNVSNLVVPNGRGNYGRCENAAFRSNASFAELNDAKIVRAPIFRLIGAAAIMLALILLALWMAPDSLFSAPTLHPQRIDPAANH